MREMQKLVNEISCRTARANVSAPHDIKPEETGGVKCTSTITVANKHIGMGRVLLGFYNWLARVV